MKLDAKTIVMVAIALLSFVFALSGKGDLVTEREEAG